jgi:acyl-coenzyme A synthetase/AMP-(fatty) acid ligase
MPPHSRRSLWELMASPAPPLRRFLAGFDVRVALDAVLTGTSLGGRLEELRGRSVLISAEAQLPAVLALAELDGVARQVLLCPPDLSVADLPSILADATVDAVVCDGTGPAAGLPCVPLSQAISPAKTGTDRTVETEWLLFTSGTTGQPKMVVHTLQSLTGPLDDGLAVAGDAVWSTFYDIRRYGGLQILLRALLGGGSMVLSHMPEPVESFLARAGAAGVSHISGTPSHWRRALMSPAARQLSPRYVRLSGEIADQAILNKLQLTYPAADIAHAFASTEAGVGFDVRDGLAGFPAALIGRPGTKADLRVQDGSLRIRSARTAARYAGEHAASLADEDGFVDTGDMVERRGDRYYFVGRRDGIINVGGVKVHPEEVEAVINQHPRVRMSRVWGRPSPITGAIVVADVVLGPTEDGSSGATLDAIRETCRHELPAHKVPSMMHAVASLDVTTSGKLARPNT